VTGMDVQASIVMVCRVALGVVFLVAAVAKLSDLPAFAAGVRDYRILSEGQDRLVGSTLPFVEAAVGIVLILGVAVPLAALVAAILLAGFTLAVGVNLLRGREIRCNCFGMATTATAGVATVVRNALLLALSASTVVTGLRLSSGHWTGAWESARALPRSFEQLVLVIALVAWCVALLHLAEATVDGHLRSSRLAAAFRRTT